MRVGLGEGGREEVRRRKGRRPTRVEQVHLGLEAREEELEVEVDQELEVEVDQEVEVGQEEVRVGEELQVEVEVEVQEGEEEVQAIDLSMGREGEREGEGPSTSKGTSSGLVGAVVFILTLPAHAHARQEINIHL